MQGPIVAPASIASKKSPDVIIESQPMSLIATPRLNSLKFFGSISGAYLELFKFVYIMENFIDFLHYEDVFYKYM